jgi:hypothetical protein
MKPEEVWGGLYAIQKWFSKNWYEVVKSGDEKHLRAGTNVQVVRTWRGVISYAAKYLGKACIFVDQQTGEVLSVGRFWGVWSKKKPPVHLKVLVIMERQLRILRRVLRRMRERGGRKLWCFRRLRDVKVTSFVDSADVLRLIEWSNAPPGEA